MEHLLPGVQGQRQLWGPLPCGDVRLASLGFQGSAQPLPPLPGRSSCGEQRRRARSRSEASWSAVTHFTHLLPSPPAHSLGICPRRGNGSHPREAGKWVLKWALPTRENFLLFGPTVPELGVFLTAVVTGCGKVWLSGLFAAALFITDQRRKHLSNESAKVSARVHTLDTTLDALRPWEWTCLQSTYITFVVRQKHYKNLIKSHWDGLPQKHIVTHVKPTGQ